MPLVVAILLAVPAGVTWLLARLASKRKEQAASEAAQDPAAADAQATDADQEINWDERYETVGDIIFSTTVLTLESELISDWST